MRGLWDRIPALARALGIVAVIAGIVVVLSLEPVVATVGGILQIAFFLAVALFLFMLWRERRGDLEAWSDWNRKLFYAAVVLAVVAFGPRSDDGLPRAATPSPGRGDRGMRVRHRPRLAPRTAIERRAAAVAPKVVGAGSKAAARVGVQQRARVERETPTADAVVSRSRMRGARSIWRSRSLRQARDSRSQSRRVGVRPAEACRALRDALERMPAAGRPG
jgi:hypothetical protein